MLAAANWRSAAAVRYVDLNSTNATRPYSTWATAATNIQDAVDAAMAGDEIVVTNGIYASGSRATIDDAHMNRLVVDKPLAVRSVQGPDVTVIDGGGSNRCVYLADAASLSGFTLTHGVVPATWMGALREGRWLAGVGGGIMCQSSNPVVSDCVIAGNTANDGGGAAGGSLNNCTLRDNSAQAFVVSTDPYSYLGGYGGGASGCTLHSCTVTSNSADVTGGGAAGGILNNCTVSENSALKILKLTVGAGGGAYGSALSNCVLSGNLAFEGGGAEACMLNNCALRGNSAWAGPIPWIGGGGGASVSTLSNCALTGNPAERGGGAWFSTLNNCTVTGNSARGSGSGVSGGTLNNCIIYFNAASRGVNYDPAFTTLNSCCTTPLPTNGVGNITADSLFVDTNGWANLRLQPTSPCINAGNNASTPAGPDLDGNPRIVGGTVDIGAYEYQTPVSQISYAWLQQYGLFAAGSADNADPDGDGVDNYHEWLAGTDPTNRYSSPAQLAILPSGTDVMLTWSTNAVGFTLQSTTNLASPSAWATNSPASVIIGGQNMVTNPISGSQQFYRLVKMGSI
jgi:hypothetical protein